MHVRTRRYATLKIYNSIVKYRLKSFERSNRNSFEWSKAGLDHIAASQARLAVKEQTDLIRVYIYSKTHGSENISEYIIADGKLSSLSIAKVGKLI